MLIKNSSLEFQWHKKFPAVFILLGQDHFQSTQVASGIFSAWHKAFSEESDKKTLVINKASDWLSVQEETSTFSLFSEQVLIDLRYESKTLDKEGKNFLLSYLKNINPRCLVLMRAPLLSLKQLDSLSHMGGIDIVLSTPPSAPAIKQWILKQLRSLQKPLAQNGKDEEGQMVDYIYQYTEGNLLASAQVLEKLALLCTDEEPLCLDLVLAQLSNQAVCSLYALADACLEGHFSKAIQILQMASEDKTEATLVLWILAQEIRNLLQLKETFEQAPQALFEKASALKIWSSRLPLYQKALPRVSMKQLVSLLAYCSQLDRRIKSSQNKQTWHAFERIALSLCEGKGLLYAS